MDRLEIEYDKIIYILMYDKVMLELLMNHWKNKYHNQIANELIFLTKFIDMKKTQIDILNRI